MRGVKLLNGSLWGLNGLLALAIALFAWQYLLGAHPDPLHGFKPIDDGPGGSLVAQPRLSDQAIKDLKNPIEHRVVESQAAVVSLFKAILRGTMPSANPKRGLAFIKHPVKNSELVAYIDEVIQFDGRPFDEYIGWKLVEVTRDSATFSNGTHKQKITMDQTEAAAPAERVPGAAPGGPINRRGQPYDASAYKSRLIAQTDGRQIWGLDPDEVEWAAQNQETLLDRDLQVSVYPGGGLKLEGVAAGSLAASRGMVGGDIVKDVNGIPLQGLADLKALGEHPSVRQSAALRITVERAGKAVLLEYRPLPRAPGAPR